MLFLTKGALHFEPVWAHFLSSAALLRLREPPLIEFIGPEATIGQVTQQEPFFPVVPDPAFDTRALSCWQESRGALLLAAASLELLSGFTA